MNRRIRVVFFQRKPLPIHRSVEYIFKDVRSRMPAYIEPLTKIFRFYSKGILPRLYIIWEAFTSQGDVNHITGDIHFAAIALKKRKTMLTVLDCIMLSDSSGLKHALLKYFWFTMPLRKCSHVTVISEATKQELLKYVKYPVEKIHVIPVAISPAFQYVPKPFNEDEPVILQVGTTPNKNLGRLIQAVKGISCHLVIIGNLSSEMIDQLKNYGITYSNLVNLTDQEMVEQYALCDVLSFVSVYEGFGMPIVEANATGRPVVTSNLLSMPEIAGNAACIVDPYDMDSIRSGILRVLHDKSYREELVQNGLINCKRFDPQDIADSYLSLYKKISGYAMPEQDSVVRPLSSQAN